MAHWPINDSGVRLLKEFESFTPFPYPDPASPLGRATRNLRWGFEPPAAILERLPLKVRNLQGDPWTIGWGFTKGVTLGSRLSPEMGDARLADELREYVDGVQRALTRPANENQLAACVVLAWNIGIAAFARSTVCKAHNRGDFEAAARAFSLWNKAGGRVMPGLTRRRHAEAALYLKPVLTTVEMPGLPLQDQQVMPQRVDPESNMFRSRIVQGGTAAGTVSALTLAAEGARAVGDIRYSLGDWLPYIALTVVVAAAAIIVWERLKQRRGGWA